jgi:hypothetical protein
MSIMIRFATMAIIDGVDIKGNSDLIGTWRPNMSGIDDFVEIFRQNVQKDGSGKIVEKVLKDVPLVAQTATEAVKAAIKIVTKR